MEDALQALNLLFGLALVLLQNAAQFRVVLVALKLTLDHLLSLFFQRQRVLERWNVDVLEKVARRRRAAHAGRAARHGEDSLVGVKCCINGGRPNSVPWLAHAECRSARRGTAPRFALAFSGVSCMVPPARVRERPARRLNRPRWTTSRPGPWAIGRSPWRPAFDIPLRERNPRCRLRPSARPRS